MTGHRPFKELTEGFSEARQARVAARVSKLKTEMALHELRQARERSQEDPAREPGVGQPAVAKLERRTEAVEEERQADARLPYGNINGTI